MSQPHGVQSIQGSLTGATQTLSVVVANFGEMAIQLAGTFTATLQFEASVDNTNWKSLALTPSGGGSAVTSATATGIWQGDCGGYYAVRVRCSAFTSGSIETSLSASVLTTPILAVVVDAGLDGIGTTGDPLNVLVDGTTIGFNVDNELEALGAAVSFKTIAVAGQSSIVADSPTDTLTVVAGSNVTITTNAGTDTITIAASGGGGGGISGSIADGQVAVGSGTDEISGSSALTFDGTTLTLAGGGDGSVLGAGSFGAVVTGTDPYFKWDATNHAFMRTIPTIDASAAVYDPVLAGVGSGRLSNGVYSFKFTWTTANGETALGTATASVTVTNHTTNGFIKVRWPFVLDAAIPATFVNVYRTKADGSTYYFVFQQGPADGGFFTDDTPDSDLTVVGPTTNTAIEPGLSFVAGGIRPSYEPNTGTSLVELIAAPNLGNVAVIVGSTGAAVNLWGGPSLTGSGGSLTLQGGEGQIGAPVFINGGNGDAFSPGGDGGAVYITPGLSYHGAANGQIVLRDSGSTARLAVDPNGNVVLPELTVATLPASPPTGSMANVSDSTTNTWGATVSGTGGNHVQVRYNGANWTVVGK